MGDEPREVGLVEAHGLRVSAVGRDLVVQIINRDEDDIGLGGVACA